MEWAINDAAVWKCNDNHYVGFVPCVVVAITDKRVKVAVMLANGKLGMRYVNRRELEFMECYREEAVVLNIRCDLKLRESQSLGGKNGNVANHHR